MKTHEQTAHEHDHGHESGATGGHATAPDHPAATGHAAAPGHDATNGHTAATGHAAAPGHDATNGHTAATGHAAAPGHDATNGHTAATAHAAAPGHDATNGHASAPPHAPAPESHAAARPARSPRPADAAVTVTTDGLPDWLDPVARAARTVEPGQLSRFLPPASGAGRQSAVLILFGEGERGPELLLMERAGSLRSHPGQPSFPGGSLDPEDGDKATTGPLRAALREAEEETGLDPRGVQLFGVLPRLYIPVSSFVVTPVLGWWREPSPVGVVDPAETARVFTVPVADLTDPAHRATAMHPSGHRGPAFLVESTLVWGFTAGVIDRILHFAGWERPWDRAKQVPLDWRA